MLQYEDVPLEQFLRVQQDVKFAEEGENACAGCVFDAGPQEPCAQPDGLPDCQENRIDYIFIKKEQP